VGSYDLWMGRVSRASRKPSPAGFAESAFKLRAMRALKSIGAGLAFFAVWVAIAIAIRAALGGTSIGLPWGLGYPAQPSWIVKILFAGAAGAIWWGYQYWKEPESAPASDAGPPPTS
jgi:hypothetical protein